MNEVKRQKLSKSASAYCLSDMDNMGEDTSMCGSLESSSPAIDLLFSKRSIPHNKQTLQHLIEEVESHSAAIQSNNSNISTGASINRRRASSLEQPRKSYFNFDYGYFIRASTDNL